MKIKTHYSDIQLIKYSGDKQRYTFSANQER